MESSIIGIRWCPTDINITSRFGLDSKDPDIIQAACRLISKIPNSMKIGMHFHFAASSLGLSKWMTNAQSFVHFCSKFSICLGRSIDVIDFGGVSK